VTFPRPWKRGSMGGHPHPNPCCCHAVPWMEPGDGREVLALLRSGHRPVLWVSIPSPDERGCPPGVLRSKELTEQFRSEPASVL
jgi:hypothetical protein